MRKNRFSDEECPIAQALNEIGDGWTLLIVREAMYGTQRFEDFHDALSIARNILSDRLKHLVTAGILIKQKDEQDRRSTLYVLTPKGRALWSILISLMTWSNRWVAAPGEHRIDIRDSQTGRTIEKLCAIGPDKEPIDLRNTVLVAGPGASDQLSARVDQIFPDGKQRDLP